MNNLEENKFEEEGGEWGSMLQFLEEWSGKARGSTNWVNWRRGEYIEVKLLKKLKFANLNYKINTYAGDSSHQMFRETF